jgi:hypothetical protein
VSTYDNTRVQFSITHEQWYWPDLPEPVRRHEVRVGRDAFTPEGRPDGCVWEFTVTEHDHGGDRHPIRLDMFAEAWDALREIPEFFDGLTALGRDATVADVAALCARLGYTDSTSREPAVF